MSPKSQKIGSVIRAADHLSLGISIVVAILIGVGIGVGLMRLTDSKIALFAGVFLGIAAAINNVFKAYKAQKASYDALKNERDGLIKSAGKGGSCSAKTAASDSAKTDFNDTPNDASTAPNSGASTASTSAPQKGQI